VKVFPGAYPVNSFLRFEPKTSLDDLSLEPIFFSRQNERVSKRRKCGPSKFYQPFYLLSIVCVIVSLHKGCSQQRLKLKSQNCHQGKKVSHWYLIYSSQAHVAIVLAIRPWSCQNKNNQRRQMAFCPLLAALLPSSQSLTDGGVPVSILLATFLISSTVLMYSFTNASSFCVSLSGVSNSCLVTS
jgi:hypothetical protein